MKYLFVLSQENIELAREEVLSIVKPKKYTFIDHYMLLEKTTKKVYNLAYTKKIIKLFFISTKNTFEKDINSYGWKIEKPYAVRCYGKLSERKVASLIWKKIRDPRINLKYPQVIINCINIKDKIYTGQQTFENKENFNLRKSHLRPKTTGNSLHPKLARCMVNLCGDKQILDPFCGTGGILIEAGLMGYKVKGCDIDEISLEKAKVNLQHYNIKNNQLLNIDATRLNFKMKNIVTDMPYGKSSKVTNTLDELYSAFFKNMRNKLVGKAVVALPNYIKYQKYIKDYKIKNIFKFYLHKNLTKIILILE